MKRLFALLLLLIGQVGQADPPFSSAIAIDPEGENRIGHLRIEKGHPIDQSTLLYVQFALEQFKKEGVAFVLLELDTPGGELFAATKICQLLLKLDQEAHIPVVAYIDNWALSAGAMLAYSCRFIGVIPSGSMGAAEPVFAGAAGEMESAPEKINSAMRAEIAGLAQVYGRNPWIAKAMVDKDLLLVERGGEIFSLNAPEEVKKGDRLLSREGKLLTLDARELIAYRVADFVAPHFFEEPFFAAIPNPKLIGYQDWKIDFFAFLSHPAVASLLFMGMVLGGYLEVSHPGFGLPGVGAIACLALILLSSFATQAINWLEVILLLLGLLFILLELFVIPGFGVVGILGIVLSVAALFALMMPSLEGIAFSFTGWSLGLELILSRLAWLSGALVLSLILIALFMRSLPRRTFVLRRFVLEEDQQGYVAGEHDRGLIGSQAVAASDLKPSGFIELRGKRYQAVSQSGYLEKGSAVEITGAERAHYIVKESTNACGN